MIRIFDDIRMPNVSFRIGDGRDECIIKWDFDTYHIHESFYYTSKIIDEVTLTIKLYRALQEVNTENLASLKDYKNILEDIYNINFKTKVSVNNLREVNTVGIKHDKFIYYNVEILDHEYYN